MHELQLGRAISSRILGLIFMNMKNLPKKRIGGKDFTVEVDESLVNKRKYNKGRMTKQAWCVEGVCRENN